MSFFDAIEDNNIEVVKWFVKMEHNVNDKEGRRETPLNVACFMGFVDIVKELVENDAIVHLKDIELVFGLYERCHDNSSRGNPENYLKILALLLKNTNHKLDEVGSCPISIIKNNLQRRRQLLDDVIKLIKS